MLYTSLFYWEREKGREWVTLLKWVGHSAEHYFIESSQALCERYYNYPYFMNRWGNWSSGWWNHFPTSTQLGSDGVKIWTQVLTTKSGLLCFLSHLVTGEDCILGLYLYSSHLVFPFLASSTSLIASCGSERWIYSCCRSSFNKAIKWKAPRLASPQLLDPYM